MYRVSLARSKTRDKCYQYQSHLHVRPMFRRAISRELLSPEIPSALSGVEEKTQD